MQINLKIEVKTSKIRFVDLQQDVCAGLDCYAI